MSKVVLSNLVKSYDNKKNIIDGINLEINDKKTIQLKNGPKSLTDISP